MITTMENYLLRGQRNLHKLALDPTVQSGVRAAAFTGSGFLLSAAGLCGSFQPLAMGLTCALTGWRALLAALGAMAGYRIFWGSACMQGVVWAALGCLLALLPGKEKAAEDYPLLLPALTAVATALTALIFLFFRQGASLALFFLRVCLAPVSAWFFRRALRCREM